MEGCLAEEGQGSLVFLHRSDPTDGADRSTSRGWGWDVAQRHPHAGAEPRGPLSQVPELSHKAGAQVGQGGGGGEGGLERALGSGEGG